MADKTIKIKIETDADTSLKSIEDLRAELKVLEYDFNTTQLGTKEFTALGAQVKAARNQLKDLEAGFEGLDKEQRATALVDTFNGLTGAVGAVSSAFIAFGADAEAIEGAERKLLGIIGIVNGLRDASNGLVAAGKLFGPTFAAVGESIKAGFTAGATGAQTFKAALISTGIGAFVVLVGLLVQAFIESAGASKDAAAAAEKYGEALEGLNRQFSVQRNEITETLNTTLKSADLEGKSIEDISAIRTQALKDQQAINKKEVDGLVSLRISRQKEITTQITDEKERKEALNKLSVDFAKQGQRLGDEAFKLEQEIARESLDLQIKQNEKRKKLLEDRNKFTLDITKNLTAALQQLRLSEAKTEEEIARVELANTLANLETERKAKVAEAEKLGLSIIRVNQTYDALNENARIKFNDTIDKIDKAAADKRFEDQQAANAKSIQGIQSYYDELLVGVDQVADDIAIRQNITSEAQYVAIEEFIKTALNQSIELVKQENAILAKGAEGQKEILLKRSTARITILEEEQLKIKSQLEKQLEDEKLTDEQRQVINEQILANRKTFEGKKLAIVDATAREIVKIEEDTSQKQKDNQQQLTEFVLNSASSLLGDLKELNSIFDSDNEEAAKKAFNRNKNLSIAEAIISTYLAAQKAYTSQLTLTPDSPIRASIAAAVAIASGLARVAVIKSQKFDGGGSTGGGGAAGGSTGSSNSGGSNVLNPFATEGGGTNVLPPRLAPPSGGGTRGETGGQFNPSMGGQIPIFKTYVLAGDVTDAQVANEKINQKRKF